MSYSHQNVDYVFIDPTFKDLMRVFWKLPPFLQFLAIGALLIVKENADSSMKGVLLLPELSLLEFFPCHFHKPVRIKIFPVKQNLNFL
ncbi:MAG: hypothetical protein CM15mP4_1070 [Candidatus Neomarinimicrobiota bacterium]|nr:MAG: hypothetical protein CM15mP4_1070 [Candidatus Neomarinimicrobiota bacterium]